MCCGDLWCGSTSTGGRQAEDGIRDTMVVKEGPKDRSEERSVGREWRYRRAPKSKKKKAAIKRQKKKKRKKRKKGLKVK